MRHGRRSSDGEQRASQVRQARADRARAQARGHQVASSPELRCSRTAVWIAALQAYSVVTRTTSAAHGLRVHAAMPTPRPPRRRSRSAGRPDPAGIRSPAACSATPDRRSGPRPPTGSLRASPSAARISAGRLRKVLLRGIAGMRRSVRWPIVPIRPEDSAQDRTAGGRACRASAMSRGRSTRASRKCPVSAKPARTSSSVTAPVARGAQERRQRQQTVLVGLAGLGRHGAARLGRDVDEIRGLARRGAGGEIEAEAQLLQQRQLPAHDQRRPHLRARRGSPARTASPRRGWGGDRARAAGGSSAAIEVSAASAAASSMTCGREALPQLERRNGRGVGQPRLPGGVDVIAGLQDGPQLARAPAVHEAQVAAVRAREQLEHGAGLAVRPHAQDHAFVAPLHGTMLHRVRLGFPPPGEGRRAAGRSPEGGTSRSRLAVYGTRSHIPQPSAALTKRGTIPACRAACNTGVTPVRKGVRLLTRCDRYAGGSRARCDTVRIRAPGAMVIGSVKQLPARRWGVRADASRRLNKYGPAARRPTLLFVTDIC